MPPLLPTETTEALQPMPPVRIEELMKRWNKSKNSIRNREKFLGIKPIMQRTKAGNREVVWPARAVPLGDLLDEFLEDGKQMRDFPYRMGDVLPEGIRGSEINPDNKSVEPVVSAELALQSQWETALCLLQEKIPSIIEQALTTESIKQLLAPKPAVKSREEIEAELLSTGTYYTKEQFLKFDVVPAEMLEGKRIRKVKPDCWLAPKTNHDGVRYWQLRTTMAPQQPRSRAVIDMADYKARASAGTPEVAA